MENGVESERSVRRLLYHPRREGAGQDQEMAWGWKKGARSQEHSGSKMGKTWGLIFSSLEWTSLQESLQATHGLRI